MIRITKIFRFEAAHRLPRHDGNCARLHGHGYILEVEVEGITEFSFDGPGQGMVVDFSRIKAAVGTRILSICDHRDLNQAVKQYGVKRDAEIENVTTAENLVALFAAELWFSLAAGGVRRTTLSRVRLYETADAWAEWRVGDDISEQLSYLKGE